MTKIIKNIIPFDNKTKWIDRLIFTPGIWVNGKMYWLKNRGERFLISEGISVKIKHRSPHSKINFFDVFVTNHGKEERQVKLLMMHHPHHIMKEPFSFVSPVEKVIYHLSNGMIYLVNGLHNGKGFHHYTIQPKWNIARNNFWDCQEKGILKYIPMLKGSAASIHTFDLNLSARGTQRCSSWSITGNSKLEINELNKRLLKTY